MTEKLEIYKCNICGNVVEVLAEGVGELICCGENMLLLKEQKQDEYKEKHVPIISIKNKNVIIKVGEIPHPMTFDHHICFIEAISLDGKYLKRKYLNKDENPELQFDCNSNQMKARALCNIHNLWSNIKQ